MKPFDATAKCPKCGSDNIHTSSCPGGQERLYGKLCDSDTPAYKFEHLHRRCERCGYEWLEATIPPEAQKR